MENYSFLKKKKMLISRWAEPDTIILREVIQMQKGGKSHTSSLIGKC